ncbi:unnamed protein product, partial [Mesorhabditis spiculigera]
MLLQLLHFKVRLHLYLDLLDHRRFAEPGLPAARLADAGGVLDAVQKPTVLRLRLQHHLRRLRALRVENEEPSWMQLFLICWTVLSIITWALWVLEWTLGVETANARVAERRAKENKPQINTRAASWILLVPVIILALIIQIILTFLYISFYRFLRDRQLEKEQHEGTMMSVQANRY